MLAPRLWEYSPGQAAAFFLLLNVAIVLASAMLWSLIRVTFPFRPIFEATKPITSSDVLMVVGAVVMNVVVSMVGWGLWKRGHLHLADFSASRAIVDVLALLLLMDLGMYVTHRLAHLPAIYEVIHRRHHEHVETNALSLFVLSPLEVLGFGSLLVGVIALVGPTEAGLTFYLAMNLIVGTIGHASVEPLPHSWIQKLPTGLLGTSTFHARHHTDRNANFGFYTTIWDRVCRTLQL